VGKVAGVHSRAIEYPSQVRNHLLGPRHRLLAGLPASVRGGPKDEDQAVGERRPGDVADVVVDGLSGLRPPERALLPQDRPVELLEGRARFDPELFDERVPCVVVGLERLSLPACPVQSEHQLAAQALAQRLAGYEPF
jgi:hypothetical protein